jgi:hypothetical protein
MTNVSYFSAAMDPINSERHPDTCNLINKGVAAPIPSYGMVSIPASLLYNHLIRSPLIKDKGKRRKRSGGKNG